MQVGLCNGNIDGCNKQIDTVEISTDVNVDLLLCARVKLKININRPTTESLYSNVFELKILDI